MRIALKIFGLMLVVVITSCKATMTKQEFINHQNAVFWDFYTNDVNTAERTLLADLQTISEWQSNHLEGTDFNIDYDGCKALDHQMLFLIYRKTGDTNKMEYQYHQSLECVTRSRISRGEPLPPLITEDQIVTHFEKVESNANAWEKKKIDSAK